MDSPRLVLVTGATGWVAGYVIQVLVRQGYRVRGTVRSLADTARYDHLYAVCGETPGEGGKLEFVQADLESEQAVWDAAVAGCAAVMHCAGPTALSPKDPKAELLDPAMKGLESILQATRAASGTVKKFVYTSSVTALSDAFERHKTHEYGPEDWNTGSSLTHNPYMYVKTLTERRVHEFAKTCPSVSFACVLPHTIMGPMMVKNPRALPDSMDKPVRGALDGELQLVNFTFGVVDVRDVAEVHVKAMEKLPEVAGSEPAPVPRYVCWSRGVKLREMCTILGEICPKRKNKLPKVPLPKWFILMWAYVFLEPGVTNYLKDNINTSPRFNTELTRTALGIEFRAPEDTIKDVVAWLEANNLFKTKV